MAALTPVLPIASLALTAIGTAASYIGSQNEAKAARQAGEYNAQVAEMNARAAQEQAGFEAQLTRERGRKILGAQRAAAAKSGVGLENVGDLLEESIVSNELDALANEYQGKVAFTRGQQEAGLYRAQGAAQASAARTRGTAGLLAGAANAAGYAYNIWGPRPTFPSFKT